MSDWQRDTRLDYERKGFAGRSGYGKNPLLLVVDFNKGFTDPTSPLGGDFRRELNATRQLQEAFRRLGLPIAYTTIAYGPDLIDQHRQAASYIDRILKGERPADLPVQAPNKYELAINLKTAKALGLIVSPALLARDDKVIE